MTINGAQGERDQYLRRLITARCGEELSGDGIAVMAESALPDADISSEMMDAVLDVIDALEMKLAALEQGLAARRASRTEKSLPDAKARALLRRDGPPSPTRLLLALKGRAEPA